jgi:pyruvate kinase
MGFNMQNVPRRTKILATLGPATDAPGVLADLISAGVNVVRMNFSHGTAEQHGARVQAVRDEAAKQGREVGILADLQGPKIRIEKFVNDKVQLKAGAKFTLQCKADAPLGDETQVACSYLGLVNDVFAGDTLLLDDGLMALKVLSVQGDCIHTEVLTDGALSNRKGLNRLGGGLSLAALTDQDKEHIKIAAKLEMDFVAVSFCRSAEDMHEARRLVREAGGHAALVAKIERAEAIDKLVEITKASDVVMVARGDLGVEIGDAELPGLQKKIIRTALEHNRIVITATQMLQSMVDNPIPTRAEVLDVANAVIDGTDAVMLSAETASGNYPLKAVEAMVRICLGAERQFHHDTDFEAAPRNLAHADHAIAMATMFIAEHIQVGAIIALTESGGTARYLSRYRSSAPIFGLSKHSAARRKMTMVRDVFPIEFDSTGMPTREAAKHAIKKLFDLKLLQEKDRVVLTCGDTMQQRGATNTLRLLVVGAEGKAEGLGDL